MSSKEKDLKKLVMDYAKALSDANDLEHELYDSKRRAKDIESDIMSYEHNSGAEPLYITDHGFSQIIERFERAIRMDQNAYASVYEGEVRYSLLTPSNFKSFLITVLASAYKDGSYSYEEYQGNDATEQYRYNYKLAKWSNENMVLEFVAIVKQNKVVTGYFNWVNNDGDG